MEKADPDPAFAWPVNLLDPALRSLASSQLLWLRLATDVANVDLDDGRECRARISGLAGGRRGRGGMRGCVLRHARSIGTMGCGRNFTTGWAVGWAVCPATTCKLLKELVGASGFEPPASWSRTRRSTRLSHAPIMWIALSFQMRRKTRRSSHLPLGNHKQSPKSIHLGYRSPASSAAARVSAASTRVSS